MTALQPYLALPGPVGLAVSDTTGEVVDDLQARPWGDWDGQVTDRFAVPWLLGFHPAG